MHTLVRLVAWDRTTEQQQDDRNDSPWDHPERHPLHANRRKALQYRSMRTELSTITAQ